MNRFTNKTIFLTGGATGIGRATALAFASEGASLALCDVAETETQETVQLCNNAGAKAIFIKTDVASAEQIQSAIQRTIQEFGGLDVGVNNAGIEGTRDKGTHEYDETIFRRVIDVNLTGVFLCMKAQLQAMLAAQKPGAIVNTSSILGHFGMPGHAAYIAAKHGVMGLTRAAALEYARYGVRINAVCPGWIETPMTIAHNEKDQQLMDKLVKSVPMRRRGTPEEIAQAILFLASDHASYITGQGYLADGGLSAL
ncbi:MAG: SDR family oxidoreductase [Candidatus Kapaibacterium sp.]|nr:MAG: SDR family oxidoreductase [Candidatus Kapabacteria bacterium]